MRLDAAHSASFTESASDPPRPDRRSVKPRHSHLAAVLSIVAAALVITAPAALGQSMPGSFGELVPLDLPEVVDRGIFVFAWPGDSAAILLWNQRSGRVLLAVGDSLRRHWRFQPIPGTPAFSEIQSADVDRDGSPELLFIDRTSRTIHVAREWAGGDTLRSLAVVASPVTPSRVIVADVNGDGFPELLVFDENEPGIQLLLNRGGRRWQPGRVIAPDLPVRDAVLTYLNNDEIPDLIAFDWVRSELHTLYGVGSGRFLDQGLYRSETGADRILLADPRSDEPVRFLMVQNAPGEVAYWSMDDRGDLARRHRIVTGGVVRSSFLVTLDARGDADLVTLLPSGVLRVHHFATDREDVETIEAGVPERAQWAFPIPVPGQSRIDVMTLVPEQLTAILLRSGQPLRSWEDSVWLSVGARPEGLVAADLNADGHPDLAVANRGSQRVSVVWGGTGDSVPPQMQIDVPRDVAGIAGGAVEKGVVRLVTTHPDARLVAAIDLDVSDHSVTTTELPVAGTPEWAVETLTGPNRHSLTVEHRSTASNVGVSVFEPIRPETYLERGLTLSAPASLLGAAVEDVDGDGLVDLIMVYKPDDTTEVSLGVAYSDSSFTMRRRTTFQEFPVRSAQRAYVWTSDVNADSLQDLVVVFPRTAQCIYTLLGQQDSTFGAPELVDSSVRIESRSRFTAADMDGDGFADIVAQVTRRGGVGWWKNKGDGTFQPWKILVSARDIGGVAVADMNGDTRPDLIVTRSDWGAVVVYDGPSLIQRAQSEQEP